MDGRGGCCIARYAGGGGGGGAYGEKKTMKRAMLKFRPIAPKPATGAGSAFGSSSSDNKSCSGETTAYVKATGRGKRKYSMANKSKRRSCNGVGRKRTRAAAAQDDISRSGVSSAVTTAVTLPLLPESPTYQIINNNQTPSSRTAPISWLSFNNSQRKQVVESVVTVECVTTDDTCLSSGGGVGLGRTDEERLRNVEWDTCPGFITDCQRRVKWINTAYKTMLVNLDDHQDHQVVVWVEMKDGIRVQEAINYSTFTCRVTVHQTGTKDIKILPCDVWRMDCGGFAWRLDVKAAISLGR